MPSFLVEAYSPGATALGPIEARVRAAAEEIARGGTPIRYLRSIYVPQDETCFHLFEAPAEAPVREASELAGLGWHRIVEAETEAVGAIAAPVEIDPRNGEFLDRLANFRNSLSAKEQAVIDAVVARAHEVQEAEVVAHGTPTEFEPPTEREMEVLVAKIDAFQATLPARDRARFDGLLRNASPSPWGALTEYKSWRWNPE